MNDKPPAIDRKTSMNGGGMGCLGILLLAFFVPVLWPALGTIADGLAARLAPASHRGFHDEDGIFAATLVLLVSFSAAIPAFSHDSTRAAVEALLRAEPSAPRFPAAATLAAAAAIALTLLPSGAPLHAVASFVGVAITGVAASSIALLIARRRAHARLLLDAPPPGDFAGVVQIAPAAAPFPLLRARGNRAVFAAWEVAEVRQSRYGTSVTVHRAGRSAGSIPVLLGGAPATLDLTHAILSLRQARVERWDEAALAELGRVAPEREARGAVNSWRDQLDCAWLEPGDELWVSARLEEPPAGGYRDPAAVPTLRSEDFRPALVATGRGEAIRAQLRAEEKRYRAIAAVGFALTAAMTPVAACFAYATP